MRLIECAWCAAPFVATGEVDPDFCSDPCRDEHDAAVEAVWSEGEAA